MAFKFPLATVLRVRTIREEREERMLQQILFEIGQTTRLIEHIDNELSRRNMRRGTNTFVTVQGQDVHASYGELASLYHHRKEVGAHLEKLEQLRALEHGYRIRVVASVAPSLEVDTAEDLERARDAAVESTR